MDKSALALISPITAPLSDQTIAKNKQNKIEKKQVNVTALLVQMSETFSLY